MFIHATLELPIPAATAINRLCPALRCDHFGELSDKAYEAGLVTLARVGPFGDVPGLAKTVRLQMLEPHMVDNVMRVPMRWVATGATGQLFPALDADLDIATIDEQRCEISIRAVYTPPLGAVGAGINSMLLHRAARATIRSLLRGLGRSLTSPDTVSNDAPELGRVIFWPSAEAAWSPEY